MELGNAQTPEGMRLYAIGDVHGMDALLAEAHEKIAADRADRPDLDYRIIHVGDYVDRGRDSAGVIDRLARVTASDPRALCLLGNHDELMRGFLADPLVFGPNWFANRGASTVRSYGIDAPDMPDADALPDLAARLAAALPPAHAAFLRDLPLSIQFGDYFFCHAGIRPGVALDRQEPKDLVWIREPFLSSTRDHGVVVVHGHTPGPAPVVRGNRIGIDSGAVFGGPLTVLVLEGSDHRFL
jgi:serine/threonine protein phosphatase 1